MLAAPAMLAASTSGRGASAAPAVGGRPRSHARRLPASVVSRRAVRRRIVALGAGGRDAGSSDAGDEGDDDPAEWRGGPPPSSSFAAMFDEARAEAGGATPPPLKRVETRDDLSAEARSTDEPLDTARTVDDMMGEALESFDADDDARVSPYCSITFVDESGDEEGPEGAFAPPMADLATAAPAPPSPSSSPPSSPLPARDPPPAPPGAPIAAWPPWLAEAGAGAPACAVNATVEVCEGKACARAGGAAVRLAVRAAAAKPPGWEVVGRKCMGLCSQACVVRVTESTNQVVHTRVTPANAEMTVLPGRSYAGDFGVPGQIFTGRRVAAPTRRVPDSPPPEAAGPSLPWSPPAAAGFLAAAIEAVERGVDAGEEPGANGDAEEDPAAERNAERTAGTKERPGRRRTRPGAAAAIAASRRVEELLPESERLAIEGKANDP